MEDDAGAFPGSERLSGSVIVRGVLAAIDQLGPTEVDSVFATNTGIEECEELAALHV